MGTLPVFWSWLRSQETISAAATIYVFPFWDSCFALWKNASRTNEQINEQNNEHMAVLFCFGIAMGPRCSSVYRSLCCYARALVARKRQFKIEFGFQKEIKNSFLWFWGTPLQSSWRAWQSYNPRFALLDVLNYCAQQQTRRQCFKEIISLYPGRTTTDFNGVIFRRAAIFSSAPALIRT